MKDDQDRADNAEPQDDDGERFWHRNLGDYKADDNGDQNDDGDGVEHGGIRRFTLSIADSVKFIPPFPQPYPGRHRVVVFVNARHFRSQPILGF